jgi:hypothetical protein
MKVDLEPEDILRVVKALELYDAYLTATQRSDSGVRELTEKLKRTKR